MRLSYAKESATLTQCTNLSDRETDSYHRTVTSIAIGEIACQRCRLKCPVFRI